MNLCRGKIVFALWQAYQIWHMKQHVVYVYDFFMLLTFDLNVGWRMYP